MYIKFNNDYKQELKPCTPSMIIVLKAHGYKDYKDWYYIKETKDLIEFYNPKTMWHRIHQKIKQEEKKNV